MPKEKRNAQSLVRRQVLLIPHLLGGTVYLVYLHLENPPINSPYYAINLFSEFEDLNLSIVFRSNLDGWLLELIFPLIREKSNWKQFGSHAERIGKIEFFVVRGYDGDGSGHPIPIQTGDARHDGFWLEEPIIIYPAQIKIATSTAGISSILCDFKKGRFFRPILDIENAIANHSIKRQTPRRNSKWLTIVEAH